ncbi:MAG: PqqD family protein [Candidatus Pacebacteria bacterium]|nr:PqqD family protein [Candidatus Paceibacterota bacterium]
MGLRNTKKGQIQRDSVFRARPYHLPVHTAKTHDDGSMTIVVNIPRPRWHRFLGAQELYVQKAFELDNYGAEVYRACDGQRSVHRIIEDFSLDHKISLAEAEVSVTTFMKTLIQRHLIRVALKPDEDSNA